MASTMSTDGPPVIRDPRFKAGRTLVQSGRANEGAVDIFGTLLEETLSKYGETSLEATPCYYEYGNALFRAACLAETEEDKEYQEQARGKAAEAAEKRAQEMDLKPAAKDSATKENGASELKEEESKDATEGGNEDDNDEEGAEMDDEEDDISLALRMMETAWSILDKHVQDKRDTNEAPSQWVLDQVPRALLGIGDVLSALKRYADAADAYTRALALREAALDGMKKEDLTLGHLKRRRQVVEANVLVAEALLACPDGEDVVTAETGDVLVEALERVDFARGYYNKARDALQETVYLMGRIAESGQDFESEKEDVCFAATLVMGVGETLAEHDERKAEASEVHPTKRQKT